MDILDYLRATRARRIALCAALFLFVWSWHFLIAALFLPSMIAFSRDHHRWPLVLLANIVLAPMWFFILAFAIWSRNPIPLLPRNSVIVRVKARAL